MNWITWVNRGSGNPASRAHAVVNTSDNRTLCGATPGDLVTQAGRMIKCETCKRALRGIKANSTELYRAMHQQPTSAYDISLARPH